MSAFELVGIAAWSFAVAVGGGAVGLVLGNLRLPLFLLAASSPAAAGGANIAVSGISAATASTTHIRAGRINWRLFGWMAPPSVAGALAGGYLAGVVSDSAVLGAIVGLLGGFVGLILGSLRMPALLRWVGETPSKAVGTNLAVGVFVGIAGLLGHLPSAAPDWHLIAVGGAASIPGALIGARLTGRLSDRALVQAIGAVLLVAGTAAGIQAFV